MEPESERWGECREKERRSDTGVEGAAPGAIVLSVSCWRGRTEKCGGLWRVVAYHMSFLLSLTICCYSLTCSGHLLPGKCVSMCPLPFMSVTLDLLPQRAPPTSLVYKVPPQRQVGLEQVEGRPIDAGIKEWRMAGGGDPWVPPR